MRSKEYDKMFYLCWLLERLHRSTNLPHKNLVEKMGMEKLHHYYDYADAYHCENPDKVINELTDEMGLPAPPLFGQLPVAQNIPPFSKMAKSSARVINDVYNDETYVQGVHDYYTSFLPPILADSKNNLFWSSKEYLVACYREGELL
ncbi:MAG: hypothetical protein FWC16_06430 [Defluviitaleaceae bacterium]|nr:hypothetical protein [Defluviitaleaceae bacterium]MCL2274546.1 hypothetical protein [Defluviitaleaceae bacterium]